MKTIPDLFRVQLQEGDRWVRIALALDGPFERGALVRYSSEFVCKLTGADALAASYELPNWEAAILSGALYAFRRLGRPPQHIVVLELEGSLASPDMDALASAVSLAVTELAGGDTSSLRMPGCWRVVAPDIPMVEPHR